MNHCAIQQNAFSTREEIRSSVSVPICPKPRRLGLLNPTTFNDYPGGSGGGCGVEQGPPPVSSSPPFFCGSPPSRVANPLIQDARFGDEKLVLNSPLSPIPAPISSGLSSSSPTSRKGGCNRSNFGNKPVVRVEGFDCLDRDRRNCSIPALA
ncbi:hypothetical protein CFP56_000199 [Quercus suber]|uniref:Uncharacterized protein n=1 Tax=Quercus suber TaxID=58331 RepID=A0AAW0MIE9_QUESU